MISVRSVSRLYNQTRPKITAKVHRPLKDIAFNANGIWRQHYELSKQLQDLHIDVALLSEIHLKPHERFFIPNYRSLRSPTPLITEPEIGHDPETRSALYSEASVKFSYHKTFCNL
jgi:hypothetical protein